MTCEFCNSVNAYNFIFICNCGDLALTLCTECCLKVYKTEFFMIEILVNNEYQECYETDLKKLIIKENLLYECDCCKTSKTNNSYFLNNTDEIICIFLCSNCYLHHKKYNLIQD